MEKKVCQTCHKEFSPTTGNQKYCSQECVKQARREYRRNYYRQYRWKHIEKIRESGRKYYRKQHPRKTGVCPICHKEFTLRHGKQKYCCDECKRIGTLEYKKRYRQEHKGNLKEHRSKHKRCPHKQDCFNCPETDCIV